MSTPRPPTLFTTPQAGQPAIPVQLDALFAALAEQINAGNFVPVRRMLDDVSASIGRHPVAEHLYAQACLLSGDPATALEHARVSVALSDSDPAAWYTLGRACKSIGELDSAIFAYRRALALDPKLAAIHISLGIAQRATGDVRAAMESYHAALVLNPDSPEAHRNLANALAQLGQEDQAALHFERGNEVLRDQVLELAEVGNDQLDKQKYHEAAVTYRRITDLAPGFAPGWSNFGTALHKLERLDEAALCYERAIALDPTLVASLNNLGNVQMHRGQYRQMIDTFDKALNLQRSDGLRVRSAVALPAIPDSLMHIGEVRARLERKVDELLVDRATVVTPDVEVDATTFYLSYHGIDNLSLQTKVARMHVACCPSLQWEAPHIAEWGGVAGRRIRIGLISKFLHSHSIGRTTSGLVAELDRSRFEVFTLHLPPVRDDHLSQFIRERADTVVVLPESLLAIRERIAGLELDILFYQDIGMESTTYFLAFSRLAPVQCLSFGHPETTGIPNMDWFVSGDLYEPADSQSHYSERLHLLENAGTLAYYYRPELKLEASRARYGLPDEVTLYVCPQTLF
ncbi:MAG: tetratricopeptide repeat protein, partial [Proteobacteria bacterium]|nr:tetratricopeptide repeat protein [Burkholderiales bacterium]